MQQLFDVAAAQRGHHGHQPVRHHGRSRSARTARSPSPSSTSATAPFERARRPRHDDPATSATSSTCPRAWTIEYGGDLFSKFELPESEILGILAAVIILHPRLRLGAGDGPADRHRAVRPRHRLGARRPAQPRHLDARLHAADGGDDRPRRRHRLRPVHRHPIPGGAPRRPRPSRTPIAEAIDTSGRAVLFAGITVIISLLGLSLMGLAFVHGLAIASAARRAADDDRLAHPAAGAARLGRHAHRQHARGAALIAVGIAVVGALVGVHHRRRAPSCSVGFAAGARVLRQSASPSSRCASQLPHRAEKPQGAALLVPLEPHHPAPPVAARSSAPWSCCSLLGDPAVRRSASASATPATCPRTQTVRKAYDLLAEGFGPGSNGPLFIAVAGRHGHRPGRPAASSSTPSTATADVAVGVPGRRAAATTSRSSRVPEDRAAGRGDHRPRRTTCATT